MNSEIKILKDSVLELISHIPEKDIQKRLLITENVLSDYDFYEDSEEIVKLAPADILNGYLESFYLKDENEKLFSEWFAVLSLYWLNKVDNDHPYKGGLHDFSNNAHNLSLEYKRRADKVDKEIKRQKKSKNKKENQRLNEKKYIRNNRLKGFAFGKYKIAYEELTREGKRVSYDAIACKILPAIKKHNIYPITRKKVIGRDKKDGTPGDAFGTLIKWFGEGVRKKKLKSPRDQ